MRPGRPGGRARQRRGTPSATGFSAWTGARPRCRPGARRGRGRRPWRPECRPGSRAEPMAGLDVPVSSKLIPGGGRWGGWKERRRLRIPMGGRGREGMRPRGGEAARLPGSPPPGGGDGAGRGNPGGFPHTWPPPGTDGRPPSFSGPFLLEVVEMVGCKKEE